MQITNLEAVNPRLKFFDASGRVGVYSLGVNLSLAALKFAFAGLSGSLALRADAIHSLIDVVASLIVITGLLIAKRKSRSFPYGLYKVENMVAVILSLLIFFAGYEIAVEAVTGPSSQLAFVLPAAAGVVLVIAIASWFSWYEGRVGRATGSPSLQADSRHFRADILASVVVLISMIGTSVGLPLDRLGAGLVVIFIVWAGWGMLSDGMRVLLDASLDSESLDAIKQMIAGNKSVAGIRSLRGRNSGRYKFVEAEISMRTKDLGSAHLISSEIEESIKQMIPDVDRVLIHYEPETKDNLRWVVPLAGFDGELSGDFGRSSYFAFITIENQTREVIAKEILANPYVDMERHRGIRAATFLITKGVDGILLRESLEGKSPFYVLNDSSVEMRITEKTYLQDAIQELQESIPPMLSSDEYITQVHIGGIA